MKYPTFLFLLFVSTFLFGQRPLYIPPTLNGPVFNLNVQSGSKVFYGTKVTPTYGINDSWLGPTLIVKKGDSITLHVKNNLTVKTTMHWHGLHVAAKNDGGPHQIILPSATWSPSFTIRNQAATFWYHPHGAGQTDIQVSKGLAGLIIIQDNNESALTIPRTYGVDDIPIILQSKAFDDLTQIAIASEMDTALFVNGTLDAYLDIPEQVIRFRLLNGSSLRTYNLGFSNGQTFYQIATDGGMLDSSISLTRLRLSPGERAEILINFSGMSGQHLDMKSFASELPNGIYGAGMVGKNADTITEYSNNFLNGKDFALLKLNVVAAGVNPISSIPTSLVPLEPIDAATATRRREIHFDTLRLLPADAPNLASGPFGMNNQTFNMDSINERINLNTTEIWKLVNHTLVAHPFHIHDVQFNIIERSGKSVSRLERGWKDVVLVMPGDSVSFVTRFSDFADNHIPFMYHCHLLHHEDDGMMGSFLVVDTLSAGLNIVEDPEYSLYPNPVSQNLFIRMESITGTVKVTLSNIIGEQVFKQDIQQTNPFQLDLGTLTTGFYQLCIQTNDHVYCKKIIKQ